MSQPSSSQPEQSPKSTRKQRRKRQQREEPPIEIPTLSAQAEHATQVVTRIAPSLLIHQVLQMAAPMRLLVCSIGNPGPYLNTLHSAGHTVLNALGQSLCYPPFAKSNAWGNGIVAIGSEFTLWQSSSLMNISGGGVMAAWKRFQQEAKGEPAKLVVVHDELEIGLGQVKVRSGNSSAKGHNGLKSINGLVKGRDYVRIGVGIGRPDSREPGDVADYVLRKMKPRERQKIEESAGHVYRELVKMREG